VRERRIIAIMSWASCWRAAQEPATPTTAPRPRTQQPTQAATGNIDGKFDVGGHKLHLACKGSGSPTIVYLHGLDPAGQASGESAGAIPSLASAKHRYCGYDRANTGSSDKVPGPLNGETSVADLHRLLQAAKIEPPYVLLGASFGGLIAHIYAATYPKEVGGWCCWTPPSRTSWTWSATSPRTTA
jgi:pimeloyl-ACP methyl ester carboxylesterase